MGIYSANRSGSMTTNILVANENYGVEDLGRILYESQCNDMTLFEAIIASDLSERKALAEGTMLLSEAEEANKRSFKEIIAALKKRILEWLQKIKGVFKAAMRKISAYILRDNKKFVEEIEAKLAKNKSLDLTGEVTLYNVDEFKTKAETIDADYIEKKVIDNRRADAVDKAAIISAVYKDAFGADISNTKEFRSKIMSEFQKTYSMGDKYSECKEILKNAKKSIEDLRKFESTVTKHVNSAVDILKAAERDAQAIDKNKDHATAIKNMSTTVSVLENVLNQVVACGIAMVKGNVKNCRVALRKAVGSAIKEDADLTNIAAETHADDLEAAFTHPGEEDPALKSAIDDAMASIEE